MKARCNAPAIAEATSNTSETERIHAANVNAYLNKFTGALNWADTGAFNWAEQEGFIERNPARALRVADPVKKRDKRCPFSQKQLERIFNAPLHSGCVDDFNGYARKGLNVIRRARFWIPLIGLFSGLRPNEICQLDVTDVAVIEGILCFVIRDIDKVRSAVNLGHLEVPCSLPVALTGCEHPFDTGTRM